MTHLLLPMGGLKRLTVPVSLACLVWLAWACEGGQGSFACMEDVDCPLGQACRAGVCSEVEDACGGCDANRQCIEGSCVTMGCLEDLDCLRPGRCDNPSGRCVGEPDNPGRCVPACSVNTVCLEGVCTLPVCRFDDDCTYDSACGDDGACRVMACQQDGQCREKAHCDPIASLCTPPCSGDSQCDDGRPCVDGYCQALPPECDNDYDCLSHKVCNPYRQCIWGDLCASGDPVACAEGRTCDRELGRCVPAGCVSSNDCERGICDSTTHLCVNRVPTGGGCVDDSQCLTADLCHFQVCRRRCPAYLPREESECPEGFLCAPAPGGEHDGLGLFCCLPRTQGRSLGAPCGTDDQCEVDLLCADGQCSLLCDPHADPLEDVCKPDRLCTADAGLGLGMCRQWPCDDDIHLCDPGLHCLDGTCVTCRDAGDCPDHYGCESHLCVADCTIAGCDGQNLYCDHPTGQCMQTCLPACASGQVCRDGLCVAASCQPACQEGHYCHGGQCVAVACAGYSRVCGALAEIPATTCCDDMACCEAFPGSGGYCCHTCGFDGSCID